MDFEKRYVMSYCGCKYEHELFYSVDMWFHRASSEIKQRSSETQFSVGAGSSQIVLMNGNMLDVSYVHWHFLLIIMGHGSLPFTYTFLSWKKHNNLLPLLRSCSYMPNSTPKK